MIKVFTVVLAFAAFLAFTPESRADSGTPEDASTARLVVIDWL